MVTMPATRRLVLALLSLLSLPAPGEAFYAVSGWRPDPLVLSKYEPYHKALTNHQRAVTRGLRSGETRLIEFPVPDDFVYPPGPDWHP